VQFEIVNNNHFILFLFFLFKKVIFAPVFNKNKMNKTTGRLFSEFPPVTTQEWEEKIAADLKGKDYEKTLVWKTNEGFPVRPYYRAENLTDLDFLTTMPGVFPFIRGNSAVNDWLIRQDIVVRDITEANKKALDILGKGATSIGFVLHCNTPADTDSLAILLKDICPEAAEINFVTSCNNAGVTQAFADFITAGHWDPEKVISSALYDPLSEWMLKGVFPEGGENHAFGRLKRLIGEASRLPRHRVVGIDGKLFGNCGATAVQELAFSLAMGSEYLSRMTESGIPAGEAAQRIKFNLSVGNNYFMEIARFRTGRLLWAHLVKAFGPEQDSCCQMTVHAETASYQMAVYDPYVNLLRTQTEAMSAALGGVHSITVNPFDAICSTPAEFSERIARNQQILLKEEAHIGKITDPAGGSYYIENLTARVAEQAWKIFLETEDRGGFVAAFREGWIQKQIKETAARRDLNYSLRRENLLGVNQFPNNAEAIPGDINDAIFHPLDVSADHAEVETLKPTRAGQKIEELRYRTDVFSRSHKRPAAFMLTIGDPAMRKARAQFSCNFFSVAGFEVIDNIGFREVEEGLQAARAAGAEMVVVCSSDDEYATIVPRIVPLLRNEILVIAGNPACRADLEALGATNFIHVRSNLLQELLKYQKMII
jgi:methylmalonyl-CoA mutase